MLLTFGPGLCISLERVAAVDSQHLHLRLGEASDATERRALRVAFNQMLPRLEVGFDRVQRFYKDLAHEMRWPLGNVGVLFAS